jgi:hypothetical protein
MQSRYEENFDREMGCSEREWLTWLPGAVRGRAVELSAGKASVAIGGGHLDLAWQTLPPRRIALMSMPRLAVQFRFSDLSSEERFAFMRYFDLFMQRGGG